MLTNLSRSIAQIREDMKTKILVINTGGTIGMKQSSNGYVPAKGVDFFFGMILYDDLHKLCVYCDSFQATSMR